MSAILGVGVAYFVIGGIPTYRAIILSCSALSGIMVYIFGAFRYPKKLNALIQDLHESYHLSNAVNRQRTIIFLTGPSGAGKSTLRDYFCQNRYIGAISAITTRPHRVEEHEVHRSISQRKFQHLLNSHQLCLVAENHGYYYGYLTAELQGTSISPVVIEVDSATAIANHTKFGAVIVRVFPASVDEARKVICTQKFDGMEDRLADLERQTAPMFVEERRQAGDIIFINRYDAESFDRFVELIDTLTNAETP